MWECLCFILFSYSFSLAACICWTETGKWELIERYTALCQHKYCISDRCIHYHTSHLFLLKRRIEWLIQIKYPPPSRSHCSNTNLQIWQKYNLQDNRLIMHITHNKFVFEEVKYPVVLCSSSSFTSWHYQTCSLHSIIKSFINY